MENNSRLKGWFQSALDSLNEQTWFQELKTKWEELDPQSRTYIQVGALIAGVILFFLFISIWMWNVHTLKEALRERKALLKTLESANDEMRQIRETPPPTSNTRIPGGTWNSYFESLLPNAGIDKASLSIGNEKEGSSSEIAKETLFDLSLKHVNIKQTVRYILALESGQRPVKLRNMAIDTRNDLSGYLDVTLAISAFTQVVPK